jgi:hypothetical protein
MKTSMLLLLGLVGCAASGPPKGSAGESREAPARSGEETCAADGDCLLVAGNPCNPCGACPGEPVAAMTRAALDHLMQTTEPCAARTFSQPGMPPPSCSPCTSSASGPPPHAACRVGKCVVVPAR